MSTATQSIREILVRQPSAARVFNRFDIDLCGHADLSLEGACRQQQLSVDQVLEKLAIAAADDPDGEAFDTANLSLDRLIQHIVRVHHRAVRQDLPRLTEMAWKVAEKCSDRAPELTLIAEQLEKLRGAMYAHIQKEERILFPFILQMDQQSIVAYPAELDCFRSVTQLILAMEREHAFSGEIVADLIRLTNFYAPPSWACATHIALFSGMLEFESGLSAHLRLENDVLFPRAIQMEAEIKARG